jgi:hypothetical protein
MVFNVEMLIDANSLSFVCFAFIVLIVPGVPFSGDDESIEDVKIDVASKLMREYMR